MYYVTTLNYSQGYHDFLSETRLALEWMNREGSAFALTGTDLNVPGKGRRERERREALRAGTGDAPAPGSASSRPDPRPGSRCRLRLSRAAHHPRPTAQPPALAPRGTGDRGRAAAGWKRAVHPHGSVWPAAAPRLRQLPGGALHARSRRSMRAPCALPALRAGSRTPPAGGARAVRQGALRRRARPVRAGLGAGSGAERSAEHGPHLPVAWER